MPIPAGFSPRRTRGGRRAGSALWASAPGRASPGASRASPIRPRPAASSIRRSTTSTIHSPCATCRQPSRACARPSQRGEKILIYGDYDVDGTTSVVMLTKAIELAGGVAAYHVPHRLKDGYGMRSEVVEKPPPPRASS